MHDLRNVLGFVNMYETRNHLWAIFECLVALLNFTRVPPALSRAVEAELNAKS